MSISEPFIRRPVGTTLLTVGLTLAGLVAFRQLPISALPQVEYPTIVVSTAFPGASAETMASSVTAPLERQFGQIPSLAQMTSVSSATSSQITLQFTLDRNIDSAQQDVQAAINAASSVLPANLPAPPTYSKSNPADVPILTLAITSDTLPLARVNDYADSILAQKISQVSGVGLVTLGGAQRPAVRVQVDPEALAGTGLTLEDVRLALVAANINAPKGTLDTPRQEYTLATDDQLSDAKSFAPTVLAYKNGSPLRLQDVATTIDGVENAQLAGWANDRRAIIVNVQRQPGANVIAVADRVKALLPQLEASLPQGIQVSILSDRTETVRASVEDVEFTLVLTIVLVVAVIYVFLRNLRATTIPGITVPLSLIGTFGLMYLLGYSLNNLSLMALTISTGFVVDDAIVMIENISRFIEEGESPFRAALKGAGQIGFTIVSLTVSLVAVLVPLLFMTGLIGRLFREFAVTLALAIGVSALLSLTLTPMMCAWILKPEPPPEQRGRFYAWSERSFERVIAGYGRGVDWVLRHQPLTLAITIGTFLLTVVLALVIPKGFFPVQDTGLLTGITEAGPDVSFSRMSELQQQVVAVIRADPDVAAVASFIGADGTNPTTNSGRLSVTLKPRADRRASATADHRPAAAEARPGRRHLHLPPGGAGPPDRDPGQPHALPVHARGRGPRRACGLGAEAPGQAPDAARAEERGHRSAGARPGDAAQHRPGHRLTAGHLHPDHRRHPLRRLRAAAGVDHLHPAQPLPGHPRGEPGAGEGPAGARPDLRPQCHREPGAALGGGAADRDHRAADHQPPGAVSLGDPLLRQRPGLLAGRGGDGDPRRPPISSGCRAGSTPASRGRRRSSATAWRTSRSSSWRR